MLLRDIIDFIEKNGEVCLSEIYASIPAEKNLVDHALWQLESKGLVAVSETGTRCSGCTMACDKVPEKVYRAV